MDRFARRQQIMTRNFFLASSDIFFNVSSSFITDCRARLFLSHITVRYDLVFISRNQPPNKKYRLVEFTETRELRKPKYGRGAPFRVFEQMKTVR